jgi:threonine synthase
LYPDDFDNIEQLADICIGYLGKYGDGKEGSIEAIDVAFNQGGFVLGAYISGKLKGLAVVAKMPMTIVMPQYHLIYIGADITAGSRGIGTRLMEEVRQMTNGNFSLHVDIENKKAIKLYEKMGLKKSYFRMIAQK